MIHFPCGQSRRLPPLMASWLFLLATGCGARPSTSAPDTPAPVVTAKVVQRDMPVRRRVIGNVEALATVHLRARVEGLLAQVHFKEGDFVKENDLLFTIDPSVFQATSNEAKAALAKDEARAKEAVRERDRNASLVGNDAVSVENYQKSVAAAASALQQVEADKAAVEKARLTVEYCAIRSPLTGVTGRLLVDRGNIVQAYGPKTLVVITQVQPIYVTLALPERYFSEVQREQQKGKLTVQAVLSGTDEKPEEGKLTFVDNTVDTTTGTITLQATFENKSKRLWPGQFVEAFVRVRNQPDAIVIPARAIGSGPEGTFVFVVKEDQTVETRSIVKEREDNELAVIAKGLKPGETVVTEGQLRLRNGAKVTLRKE